MRFVEYWRSFCDRKKREYRLDLKQGLTILVLGMTGVNRSHSVAKCYFNFKTTHVPNFDGKVNYYFSPVDLDSRSSINNLEVGTQQQI